MTQEKIKTNKIRAEKKDEELVEKIVEKLKPAKKEERPFEWKEFTADHEGNEAKVYKIYGKKVRLRPRQTYKYKEYV